MLTLLPCMQMARYWTEICLVKWMCVINEVLSSNIGFTEGITSAEFHPTHCNKLAYGSSEGSIRLIDLRQLALCDTHSQLLESTLNYGLERVWTVGYMKGSRR